MAVSGINVSSLLAPADPRATMRYARARERLDTSAAYDLAVIALLV